MGYAEDRRDSRAALGTFHEADVVAVETRELGQLLLAEPLGIAMAADFMPERPEVFFIPHAASVALWNKTIYLLSVSDRDSFDL
jgi:hypothetical protein